MSNLLSKLIGQNTSRNKPNVEIVCTSYDCPDGKATFQVINGEAQFYKCGC